MITKKMAVGLILLVSLIALPQVSIAAERIYDLKVSGCWN